MKKKKEDTSNMKGDIKSKQNKFVRVHNCIIFTYSRCLCLEIAFDLRQTPRQINFITGFYHYKDLHTISTHSTPIHLPDSEILLK